MRMCLKVEDSSTRAYRYEVPQNDCSIGPLFKVPSIFYVLVFLFIQREGYIYTHTHERGREGGRERESERKGLNVCVCAFVRVIYHECAPDIQF